MSRRRPYHRPRRPPRPKVRSTPAGEHVAVMLPEVLRALEPRAGQIAVDCTVGWGGHAAALLQHLGADGRLIGIDLDADNLARARSRLEGSSVPVELHHGNFAGLPGILAAQGIEAVDLVLADLGMSSMQVDDAERGFSYRRDGPLDMRMDRSRGRSAARLLQAISETELREALSDLGDEPEAAKIAAAIVAARTKRPLERTTDLVELIMQTVHPDTWRLHPSQHQWKLHPAARTFQALRILVNRELANLEQVLRVLPQCLRPGGRAALISFHSGEDRLIKNAFREGLRSGIYQWVSPEPVRASAEERLANPRSRSAKLRVAYRNLSPRR